MSVKFDPKNYDNIFLLIGIIWLTRQFKDISGSLILRSGRSPFELFYDYRNNFIYYDDEWTDYFLQQLNKTKIRFIILPLFISTKKKGRENIIIIDKYKKTIERIDPGYVKNSPSNEKINKSIKEHFLCKDFIEEYIPPTKIKVSDVPENALIIYYTFWKIKFQNFTEEEIQNTYDILKSIYRVTLPVLQYKIKFQKELNKKKITSRIGMNDYIIENQNQIK